ncbi:hypothetical protein Fcan01_10323 [Folsomia candida]|uniref:SAM domain-containing protein n=1 Tax=Folsomia candida TaxID=158441 RepID=A0A226E6Z4_FOLCA|nr:hypothetical protein Fcan01_10323 [Folsomia candida]
MEELMEYAGIFDILKVLQLEQYSQIFHENLLTDKNLLLLTNSGILVEQLKEIIPPLAHRLLILQQLNQTTFSTPSGQIGNDALSSNQVQSLNNIEIPDPSNSDFPPRPRTPLTQDNRHSRPKRRKLFHGEEPDIIDIHAILTKSDLETRTSNGKKIIDTAANRNPLNFQLRKKLVATACHTLMSKTNSSRPSTDQRSQLAACIVNQLFGYMSSQERINLQMSYFTPSCTYKDQQGKAISKRPMGYIQSWFVNFWNTNKPSANTETNADTEVANKACPDVSALFLLALLIRPKNKKISQIDAAEAFIKVTISEDIQSLITSKTSNHPQVVAVGNKFNLDFTEFFVLFEGKGVKCDSLLQAIDLSFKSFYVFRIEFPSQCYGAYQFLDYAIYKMKPVCTVSSTVKELTAYACCENLLSTT